MPKSRMTPRKEQALKTRQEIFETAIELFDKKGYERVSINDICRQAGVSTGAFYHHFKSKDQILMEEFMKTDDFYRQEVEKVGIIDDFQEKLKVFTLSTMRFLADMGLKRLKVTYHTQIGPDKKASYLGNEKRALYSILEALYREGQERGEVRRDVSSDELARLAIHCFRGIIYDWCLANGSFDMVEASEKMFDILTRGTFVS
ncbi:MAG: TetR/AcrR family transcriptional regulator [Actinobacteria bacterium]|jgi:AcrR family transcriptional regulator|nr:MAG: TetR/AcrR family transcriptional regulator [Actinomycetota bacterium]